MVCLPLRQSSVIDSDPDKSRAGMAPISPAWGANMSLRAGARFALSSEHRGSEEDIYQHSTWLWKCEEINSEFKRSEGGRADRHRAVRMAQMARANSLLHGIPSFVSVYLDFFPKPLRSLWDFQHLEAQFKIPSQAKNLLRRQKGWVRFFLAFEVPRVLIRIENRVTIHLPGLFFFFLHCVLS